MTEFEQMDDELLLKRYVEHNDRDALGALFTRHAGAAYTTALRVCRNQADAEDAVQSAFVNVMQNAASFRGGSKFGVRAWITKIVIGTVKNKIRSEVRRRMREEEVVESGEDLALPEGVAGGGDPNELTGAVDEALKRLPEHYRLPIVLHHCEGLSLRETAEMLEVSESTLSIQLTRGIKTMRRALAAGGVLANGAAIMATLPLLPPESVPVSLLSVISKMLAAPGGLGAAAPAAAAGAGLFKPLAIGVTAAAVAAAGGVILVQKQRDKPVMATAAAPAVAGQEYVDSEVVLADDFGNGLGNWTAGLRYVSKEARETGKEIDYPEQVSKCVRIEDADVFGKKKKALIIDEPGVGLLSYCGLNRRVNKNAFSIDFDCRTAVFPTHCALLIIGNAKVKTIKENYAAMRSQEWQHSRYEIVLRNEPGHEAFYDARNFIDGILCSHYEFYGEPPNTGFSVTKGALMIANVVIREMKPKAGVTGDSKEHR